MHTTTKPTFWQLSGVHNWFLKKETGVTETFSMTPDLVYKYIIEKFKESVAELSFADRVIFYHEYIICFSPPRSPCSCNFRSPSPASDCRSCSANQRQFSTTRPRRPEDIAATCPCAASASGNCSPTTGASAPISNPA